MNHPFNRNSIRFLFVMVFVAVILIISYRTGLISISPKITIRVITTPKTAKIYIDGTYIGVAPLEVSEVLPGSHTIQISKDGYQYYEEAFIVEKKQALKTFKINLIPLETGRAEIQSTPKGAEVYINGELKGHTPVFLKDISPGTVKVELKKEGFDIWAGELRYEPFKGTKLDVKLIPKYGKLDIESVPTDAVAYINGKEAGMCPLSTQVEAGNVEIKIKKTGFDDWEKSVQLNASEDLAIKAELISSYGSLKVDSTPSGAEVYIDGVKKGKTPFFSTKVIKGNRKIEIRMVGYDVWRDNVLVKPDNVSSLKADFENAYAGLSINTNPEGAEVFINGRFYGNTPLALQKIQKGLVNLELKKECYLVFHKKILLKGGQKSAVELDLESKCAAISVTSQPSGARWYFNEKLMGRTPGEIENIASGNHRIDVEADNYIKWSKSVTTEPKKKYTLSADLESVFWQDPITGMAFVWVPGGCYSMGCGPWTTECNSDELPVHKVCLDGFWIGRYEVTVDQWNMVMVDYQKEITTSDSNPVSDVSWDDAKWFAHKLNSMNKKKYSFRLPTEAEWEFAARSGGKEEIYSGSKNIDLCAWYQANSGNKINPVGKKAPNGLGLFDMSGNVWEWVEDIYSEFAYLNHGIKNPVIIEGPPRRVFRGGSYRNGSKWCRTTYRDKFAQDNRDSDLGFRLVRNP